ncbi:uncharacterized protein I303_101786 [Kwoniella dejecticola CBS 10117]|uniref:C2H2-type domain-containing protein n=1 Tax=Kwoniella dejecticola CBS 10117 TaxID=1296121 RepID=A0A1A6ACT0_9TREE|nr:uncharacterized protein I303_02078 [Kwoniella dejecticola CBS 10117]OBR87864.1 hypothetical protein I303_02078 [Kwoniella dejecticola CBS 10117]
MSDEAERRQAKRRMLEERLRALDDEERYNARSAASNPSVTGSSSYPPQWAATVSNPTSSRHGQANLTSSIYNNNNNNNNEDQGISTRNAGSYSTNPAWPTATQHQHNNNHDQQQQQQQQQTQHYGQAGPSSYRTSSSGRTHNNVPTQPHSYSQTTNHTSTSAYSHSHYSQPQTHSHQSGLNRPQSFRELDRSSAGPSSSISPQIQSAIPNSHTHAKASTFGSANSVPLPSEKQLHDWLTDCMGQPDGLATDWRIRGRRVDMYKLLASVIRAGGSTEVSSRGWWYMLAKLLELADDSTPQATKSSIAKQLQELSLLMLGGLEILWDKTKGTEERAALPRTRESTNTSNPSSFRHPVTATMNTNQNLYGQQQPQQASISSSGSNRQGSDHRRNIPSPQQQHHYVDPSKLTLPPKASRVLNTHQSSRLSESASSSTSDRQKPQEVTRHANPFQSLNNPVHSTDYASRHSNSSVIARPDSAASSNQVQQSPNTTTQLPLHQPTPSHPPPQRVPDLLSSHSDATTRSHISPNPPASSLPKSVEKPSSSAQKATRTVQLRSFNQNLGEYPVPKVNSFKELVNSGALPLPSLDRDSNLYRMTWSSDPLIQYSKRCHELGHSVRKLKEGVHSRQITSEELVFWAKLLAIMAGNPSVIPPPVDDRPQSNPPPAAAVTASPQTMTSDGPLGSFTNPVTLIPPERAVNDSNGSVLRPPQSTAELTDAKVNAPASGSQPKKRRRKSGEDKANGDSADVPSQPKKRGRKPKVPPITTAAPGDAPIALSAGTPTTMPMTGQKDSFYHPPDGQMYSPHQLSTGRTDASIFQPAELEPGSSLNAAESGLHEEQEARYQVNPALAVLPSIPAKRPTYAKRGRPKGSKTVNRKAKPAQAVQPHSNGFESHANNDSSILVPASQPEDTSYSQFDSLAQLSHPVSTFEGLFQGETAQEHSSHPNLPESSNSQIHDIHSHTGPSTGIPISSQSILATMYNSNEQSMSTSTPGKPSEPNPNHEDGSSKKRILIPEEKARLAEKNRLRYQKKKAYQNVFGPYPKSNSKYSKLGPGFLDALHQESIPLILDISPRKRIDLTSAPGWGSGVSSAAKLRTQDSPFTRIYRKPATALTTANGIDVSDVGIAWSQLPSVGKGNYKGKGKQRDVQSEPSDIEINIDPSLNQDDGYEPSPAQVQELARALVEGLGPIPDAATLQDAEGEEEVIVDADVEEPVVPEPVRPDAESTQASQSKKKAARPVKAKKTVKKALGMRRSLQLSTNPTTRSGNSSPALTTPSRRSVLVVEVPSSKKIPRVKFETSQPQVQAEAEEEVDELDPEDDDIALVDEKRDSSPEYQPSPEPEEEEGNGVELSPSIESEAEETTNAARGVKVDSRKSKPITKKQKVKATIEPVDRAKVVIPIKRTRREELISRGHYNPFRDDDSEDETLLLQRRAHAGLRPVKLTVQRGSRTVRPSSPEPIPLRFVTRPGPALLEPFASILSEQSILNRSKEYPCLWKGCDSVLASERRLQLHVKARAHARQGQEQVSTERWSWNTRRTTEREIVLGKWFYRCHWKGCDEPCFTSEKDLEQHLTARHVSRVLRCPFQDCELTSLNFSHLSRHVTKTHDSPSDKPAPLADLSVHLVPSPPPAEAIPETARTDELITPPVVGSVHKSAFYAAKIREKVASHCFAGEDPIIHPQHPPHILQTIEDDDVIAAAEADNDEPRPDRKRRLEVIVEIPLSKRRKLTEEEKRDRILRLMDAVDPQQAHQDHDHDQDQFEDLQGDNDVPPPGVAYESAPTPWIETDALMIEDELVLGAPTPAPFSFWNDEDDEDDDNPTSNHAGPSGTIGEDFELPLPLFGLQGDIDLEDEEDANAELLEESEEDDEEEDTNLFGSPTDHSQTRIQAQGNPTASASTSRTTDRIEIAPFKVMKDTPSSLFGPPSTSASTTTSPLTGTSNAQDPFFPPTRPRQASISFASALRNTSGTNSPLRFGFADRFVVQPLPLPSPLATPTLTEDTPTMLDPNQQVENQDQGEEKENENEGKDEGDVISDEPAQLIAETAEATPMGIDDEGSAAVEENMETDESVAEVQEDTITVPLSEIVDEVPVEQAIQPQVEVDDTANTANGEEHERSEQDVPVEKMVVDVGEEAVIDTLADVVLEVGTEFQEQTEANLEAVAEAETGAQSEVAVGVEPGSGAGLPEEGTQVEGDRTEVEGQAGSLAFKQNNGSTVPELTDEIV